LPFSVQRRDRKAISIKDLALIIVLATLGILATETHGITRKILCFFSVFRVLPWPKTGTMSDAETCFRLRADRGRDQTERGLALLHQANGAD
jgi:hypothetical protein